MTGYVASSGLLRGAAHGIGTLDSHVADLQRLAAEASRSLSGRHPWGLLGEIYLRDECRDLMAEFQTHVRHMRSAVKGASKRLDGSATTYSKVEKDIATILGLLGADLEKNSSEKVRDLNPASRFYRDHRTLHGMIVALPAPFGALGSTVLDTVRLVGDATSDDKYNIGTDIAMLGTDLTRTGLEAFVAWNWIRANPFGYFGIQGVGFLATAFYWAKDAADWVTGDPIRTGQAAYNFDSLAQGCRQLAQNLDGVLQEVFDGGAWQGSAADTARVRLVALRDGIEASGHSAENAAALLQLASAFIGCLEGIVIMVIVDVLMWAARVWFDAQLLAAGTSGASLATAATQISARSVQASGKIGRLIAHTATQMRAVATTMRQVSTRLKSTQEQAFLALQRSTAGQRAMTYPYGANYVGGIIRRDAGIADTTALGMRHALKSWTVRTRMSPYNRMLSEYGFYRYPADKRGQLFPDGKQRISAAQYVVKFGGQTRAISNYPGVFFISAKTLLPFGRAAQYKLRTEDVESTPTIDRQLNIWRN